MNFKGSRAYNELVESLPPSIDDATLEKIHPFFDRLLRLRMKETILDTIVKPEYRTDHSSAENQLIDRLVHEYTRTDDQSYGPRDDVWHFYAELIEGDYKKLIEQIRR